MSETKVGVPMLTAVVAGKTALGERVTNEDAFLVVDLATGSRGAGIHRIGGQGVLLVLSDGMGGANFGEVASEIAVETVRESVTESWVHADRDTPEELQNDFRKAFARANRAVRDRARQDPALHGMGATLTAVGLLPDTLVLAQVGDSRCYHRRPGRFTQITLDQTVVADMVASGQITAFQAEDHPKRNVLSQAIGYEEDLRPQCVNLDLRPGDQVLLCSDGLTDVVPDQMIEEILATMSDPGAACERLVGLALERAEHAEIPSDNVTVLLALVSEDPAGIPASPSEPGGADRGAAAARSKPRSTATRAPSEPEPDRIVELTEQMLRTLRSLELLTLQMRLRVTLMVGAILVLLTAILLSVLIC
jgi:serine/threonine protein phosphatase PrpC